VYGRRSNAQRGRFAAKTGPGQAAGPATAGADAAMFIGGNFFHGYRRFYNTLTPYFFLCVFPLFPRKLKPGKAVFCKYPDTIVTADTQRIKVAVFQKFSSLILKLFSKNT
jgi:hypothetical protein